MRAAAVAAVLVALLFVGSALGADSPKEEVVRCHGARATIIGTEGPDKLRGTPQRDVIVGLGDDDEITGSLGNDTICGGPGAAIEQVVAAAAVDQVGAGDDDRVIGDLGDDTVLGGPGEADEVAGSLGIDTVSGGPGDFDLVHGDYGYDRMDGGAGKGDIASFATDVGAGKSGGVRVSLAKHMARGDGHDRLFRFESVEGSANDDIIYGDKQANAIDGGPGKDTLVGGGGADTIAGGEGSDGCKGAKGRTESCGREAKLKASAYVQVDDTRGGGGGLEIVGGGGPDDFVVTFAGDLFSMTAAKGVAVGPGCAHVGGTVTQVSCTFGGGPARWLTADLGPGDDKLLVEGSVAEMQNVRLAGGLGDDTIKGGDEDDLIEAGFGADRLYGGAGSDGLIGSTPGPTFLYGEGNGDLLAAGGGCAGGAIVGGPGRDDASFAETQAHPGLLYVSFPQHKAWIDAVPHCHAVHLSNTDEDMEGSFDNDVLIGNGAKNSILGQPGEDRIYGNGGDDVLDARDSVRDVVVQCSPGHPIVEGATISAVSGRAFIDTIDPAPVGCGEVIYGHPVDGLHKSAGEGPHHGSSNSGPHQPLK